MFKKKKANKSVQKGDGNINIQDVSIKNYHQQHDVIRLAAEGKYEEAAELLGVLLKATVPEHPVAPYWRYVPEIHNGKVVFKHMPTSLEALHKYPSKSKILYNLPNKYNEMSTINVVTAMRIKHP